MAGTDMRQAIPQQMQDAGKVIILDTPVSSQSPWVNYEAGLALALEKPSSSFTPKTVRKAPSSSAWTMLPRSRLAWSRQRISRGMHC